MGKLEDDGVVVVDKLVVVAVLFIFQVCEEGEGVQQNPLTGRVMTKEEGQGERKL